MDASASYIMITTYVALHALTNNESPARVGDCGGDFGVHIRTATEAERSSSQLERLPRRTLLVQVLVAVFVERRRARQAAGLGSSNKHLDLEVDVGLSGKRPRSLERLSDPLDLRCNCVERLEGSALSHA
jgi:hypothetical protein